MTYTHLTTDELATIYSFWKLDKKAYRVAPALHRSAETVYRIYRFLDAGGTIIDYQRHYRRHKQHCGRQPIQLASDELAYIQAKIQEGGNPIRLLIATNVLLAVASEPYIAFLNVILLACSPKIYLCMVSITLMGTLNDEEKLVNWAEI